MDEIIEFLLARDKFMSQTYFRQPAVHSKPGFTFISCRSFTKDKKWIQKLKIREDSRYFYQNELDIDCFEHEKDMGYFDIKNLPIRTLLITHYLIKLLIMLKFQNMMDIEEVLLQCFIIFFIKSH